MKPIKFKEANKTYTAPKDWDAEKHGECGDLHVYEGDREGRKVVVSCWQPTKHEALRISKGEPIFLEITGGQPPVGISVAQGRRIPKLVKNRLRVVHLPDVDATSEAFIQEVRDEYEASLVSNVLANQHLRLEEIGIIGDYSNVIVVEMWDDDMEADEDGEKWCNYWNEEELMEWEEFERGYILSLEDEQERR